MRRYRDTHFALAKWDTALNPYVELVRDVFDDFDRRAPFDLLHFPSDSAERFVGERGEINLKHEDLEWMRLR